MSKESIIYHPKCQAENLLVNVYSSPYEMNRHETYETTEYPHIPSVYPYRTTGPPVSYDYIVKKNIINE